MDVEKCFFMVGGSGETSHAANSKTQEKAILMVRPMLEEAVGDIYRNVHPEKMVVADLGCSSGPNTLVLMSEVIKIISNQCQKVGQHPPEMLFFLNDLRNNDFNNIFRSLDLVEQRLRAEKVTINIPYFVAGLPGSFYRRLFPRQSVHIFHSSYSLMWISQVPKDIGDKRNGMPLNKGNIYIGKTSPPHVVKLYQEQFHRDFSQFLKLRFEELVPCGQMLLSFLGRKKKDILDGELSTIGGWFAESLDSMVREGLVEEENLDNFNLPFYSPSAEEVKAIVNSQGLFDIIHFQTFESNLDPFDDDLDDVVLDNVRSGANYAKALRSVLESMIVSHFGSHIVDDLFSRFATKVAKHLIKEKLKVPVLVLSLKKKEST
ncbi:anthranilate O-methyltransferase 1-like protein [Carex littledalei]|uniref:Anthranilate O-methyltransferase 1-like protein n=1 Tax=Carex littledalei TaxID=544730 RepID=A0A833RGI0_9POAL|nr:anthranilate O-methyltransferase 1-like protein [Carex littledalei]